MKDRFQCRRQILSSIQVLTVTFNQYFRLSYGRSIFVQKENQTIINIFYLELLDQMIDVVHHRHYH
ncbi:hypothetical protein DERP_005322 [Dermatophagoides pteronyssinus]|uniref:Uncharacterized protein n=1 Tax=Dermatophagoides pteronyssinus TaxID=6956 RepID=A0ABQ8JMA9_DERPT|nr:hypothetical protein DERP_005322 [Dermatophagoides pteronyssinus]